MMGRNNDGDDSAVTLPSQAELGILQLAQSHFAAQALVAIIRLGVLDVLDEHSLTVDEIITKACHDQDATTINRDALFRCLRLLCTVGVIQDTTKNNHSVSESAFLLTEMGQLLQQPEYSSFVLHWAELPLWNAWSQLPDYVAGKESSFDINTPPFDRANGMTASDYYKNNPDSCTHRNSVARYASSSEINSILDAMQHSSVLNESILDRKNIVDIGGGYGDLMNEVKHAMPSVGECYCLDLPDVIDDALSTANDDNAHDRTATLVAGNMFDPTTIPQCDFIFTKHVLCDFSDDDVIRALQSFDKAISKGGKVVIMDAILPNGSDLNCKWNPAVAFDVLLMLSGRRGERSRLEWSNLAEKAGFVLEDVLPTSSVTVDLAVLTRA